MSVIGPTQPASYLFLHSPCFLCNGAKAEGDAAQWGHGTFEQLPISIRSPSLALASWQERAISLYLHFCGGHFIILWEMEGSDEGEVSLKISSTPGKTDFKAQGSHKPEGRNCFI